VHVTRDALAVEQPMWMLGDGAYSILDWHDHLLRTTHETLTTRKHRVQGRSSYQRTQWG